MSKKENIVNEGNSIIESSSEKSLDKRMSIFFNSCAAEDDETVELCKKKAEEGDYNAMLWLARMYRDGAGVAKNKSKALAWYKKSKDHSVYSKFELLVMLSNQKRKFKDVPEGLMIDARKKDNLFVNELDSGCMNTLVYLFPFTNYCVTGFSYKNKIQCGYNEDCNDYDKILIADVNESFTIKERLISKGISPEKIITVKRYLDKDKFDGDAIICNFGNKTFSKSLWVLVPNMDNTGLLWNYRFFKKFKGEILSNCNYIVDAKNHFSPLMNDDEIGLYNSWDYFFQQMSDITLEEAYTAEGVIISKWLPKKIIMSKLLPEISATMKKKIELKVKKFGSWNKVLGVIARGTDYISLQPLSHYVPLDEYELIEIIEERMKSLGFTDVYLSTEDQEVYEAFEEHFGCRMFAVDQNRFRKEVAFNSTRYDVCLSKPFDKLMQAKRYLIASYLVIKCEAAILCAGSASDIVRENAGSKLIETHTKGIWGNFGRNPLIIHSHNKNRISLINSIYNGKSAKCVDSKGYIEIGSNSEVTLSNVDIHLKEGLRYVCSFKTKELDSVSISLLLSSVDKNDEIIYLNNNDSFIAPFDVSTGTVAVRQNVDNNAKIGIQIENGFKSTIFEHPRYSCTQICMRDSDDNEFSSEDLDYIDFNRGIFCIKGTEHLFDYKEVDRFHKIICFDSGFLTYYRGIYNKIGCLETKTSISKAINSYKIIGRPRQLRRFSHTIELADNLIKGSCGDVEKALCIYHYHAIYDVNAIGRLGRAYREGKGVEKDLDKAADWMRKAADKNVGWAKNELFDILWRIETPESYKEMISVATAFADQGDGNAMGRLGRAYREGKGVEKDLDKAADLIRKAVYKNIHWTNELFDILWRIGTEESYKEMIPVVMELVDKGDGSAMGWLGRAYREGKGVEKDLDKAADWMRKAADKNVGWAKNELFDILWRIETPESYKEMISVATAFADQGDGNAMGRLGRAYREGKGVEKDLDKAADLIRKAVYKNIHWTNELFDILWRIGTEESYKEMIPVVMELVDKGDGSAMGWLGRAYREGKGVEKDLDKAADWMRKAADKNVGWAKNELFDILWRIGTEESYKEMIPVVMELVDKGDGSAMGWLGRAYREGKGVEKDLDKAADWMRKAADKNVGWAKNELLSLLSEAFDSSERVNKEIDRIKKIDDGPFSVKFKLNGDKLKSDVDGSVFDYYIATLFRDGKKVSEVKSKSPTEIWTVEGNGIYHLKFKIWSKGEILNVNSVAFEYFTEEYIKKYSEWLDGESLPQTSLDFYASNKPYQDFLIVSNGIKLEKNIFSNDSFKRKTINGGTCEIIYNGSIYNNGIDIVFSGVSVVKDRLCFGAEGLQSFLEEDIGNSIGDFTMVLDGSSEVSVFTDYFGMGKLYYYVDKGEFCISNRLHLIISYLPVAGVKLNLSRREACAPFYARGMLGDQPNNEATVVNEIYLLPPTKSISIKNGKISFDNTDFYNVLLSPISYSEEHYQHMLSDAVNEVTNGIKALTNSGKFDKYIIDVTGGLDSRMAISALSQISDSNLNTYARTYGDYDERKCASNLVKEMGFLYDPAFIKFSKSFDLNKLDGVPWVSDDEYLNLLTSTMYNSFDFSARINNVFNASNLAIITGNAGEAVSRPFMCRGAMYKISFDKGTDHLVNRVIEDFSSQAVTGYESCGKFLKDQLLDSFNMNPCDTLEKKLEGILLFYRNRFHFDMSHKISYSTFNWTPLMSRSLFKLFYSSNDNFKDYSLVNEFVKKISHFAYTSEYSSYHYNLEMIKSINELDFNESLKIKTYNSVTDDFNKLGHKEKEITIESNPPDLNFIGEIDLSERTLNLLNYVIKGNKEIGDSIGLPVYHGVNIINNDYSGVEKYRRLYHLYKKVATIAYTMLAFDNKDLIVVKYMVPFKFYCGKDSIVQIEDNFEDVHH